MSVETRFLNYVKIDSESDPTSTTAPSSMKQFDIANYLKDEMISMGIEDVVVSEHGIVYGKVSGDPSLPKIGFIAHLDTSPDFSGKDVNPRIIKNYDGSVIELNPSISMSPKDFPSLNTNIGEDLIVTDGTTLLGGDDKAGIAEILEMVEYVKSHPEIKHGDIKIAFTPDEEVGRGTENFDIPYFDADFAYTVDGGLVDHIDYENFNAYSAKVTINGKGIHPGSAKDKMINSMQVAFEFDSLLPVQQRPQYTENYEGFNHLNGIEGNVDQTHMDYIIRNHDENLIQKQIKDFENAKQFLDHKYGYEIVDLDIKLSYLNMRKYIEEDMRCVDLAKEAMISIGLTPHSQAIRGGTDGATLTYNGLKCPNLGTGGYNAHGKYEYVSIQQMHKVVELLIAIIQCSSK